MSCCFPLWPLAGLRPHRSGQFRCPALFVAPTAVRGESLDYG